MIGLVLLGAFAIRLVSNLRKLFLKTKPLLELYGKNSFVLVTGSSDGIGKWMAKYFYSKGFSVILNGRNRKKLEAVKQ